MTGRASCSLCGPLRPVHVSAAGVAAEPCRWATEGFAGVLGVGTAEPVEDWPELDPAGGGDVQEGTP